MNLQAVWAFISANRLKLAGLVLTVLVLVNQVFPVVPDSTVNTVLVVASFLGISVIGVRTDAAHRAAAFARIQADNAVAHASSAYEHADDAHQRITGLAGYDDSDDPPTRPIRPAS